MTTNARRFIYPLEVLRTRAHWHLGTLLSELASTNRLVAATKDELSHLRCKHVELAAEAALTEKCVIDPARARRMLVYLADVRGRMQSLHRQLESLEVIRDEQVERTLRQETRLDALDRHRSTCLNEHIARSAHHEAVENDDQWLARMQWCALEDKNPKASVEPCVVNPKEQA